jgi:hypothetical protein
MVSTPRFGYTSFMPWLLQPKLKKNTKKASWFFLSLYLDNLVLLGLVNFKKDGAFKQYIESQMVKNIFDKFKRTWLVILPLCIC